MAPQLIVSQTLPAIITNDSVWYLDQTHTWSSPRPTDYYAADGRPVEYELTYPPGYPLFLDLCHLFVSTKNWAAAVVVAQHVLSFLTALLVYLIGSRCGHPLSGCAAAALYGLHFPRLLYAQALMSETLFAFLLVLSVHLALTSLRSGPAVAALAGVGFAGAAITKLQGVAGIPLVLLLYAYSRKSRSHTSAFLASVATIGALTVLHNLAFYGHPRLTTFTGKHLANRVFSDDGLVDSSNPDTRYIIERIGASGLPYEFPGAWWEFERALRTDGSTPLEADRRILRAALAGIRMDPWRYARNTAVHLFGNLFLVDDFDASPYLTRESFAAHIAKWTKPSTDPSVPPLEYQARSRVLEAFGAHPPPLRLGSAGQAWVQRFSSPWLQWRGMAAWFLVVGVLFALACGTTAAFVATLVVATSLPGALFEHIVPRYFEPVLPLALLASCIATASVLSGRARRGLATGSRRGCARPRS